MAFVPQQTTHDLWSDIGQPSSLTFPLTGTSDYGIATYKGCDGEDLIDVNLNLVLVQVHRNDLIDGGDAYNWFGQSLKVMTTLCITPLVFT